MPQFPISGIGWQAWAAWNSNRYTIGAAFREVKEECSILLRYSDVVNSVTAGRVIRECGYQNH